jgi:hypothetical protein
MPRVVEGECGEGEVLRHLLIFNQGIYKSLNSNICLCRNDRCMSSHQVYKKVHMLYYTSKRVGMFSKKPGELSTILR